MPVGMAFACMCRVVIFRIYMILKCFMNTLATPLSTQSQCTIAWHSALHLVLYAAQTIHPWRPNRWSSVPRALQTMRSWAINILSQNDTTYSSTGVHQSRSLDTMHVTTYGLLPNFMCRSKTIIFSPAHNSYQHGGVYIVTMVICRLCCYLNLYMTQYFNIILSQLIHDTIF